MSADVVRLQVC